MKKLVLIFAALALVGCAPRYGCYQKSVTRGMNGDIKKKSYIETYKAVIAGAIMDRVVNLDKWNGKECSLNVKFNGDGKVKEVNYISGDDKFCSAMADAIYSATFPAFTGKGYTGDHEIRFDFRPGGNAPLSPDDDLLGDLSAGRNAPRS